MGERGAPRRTRKARRTSPHRRQWLTKETDAFDDVSPCTNHHKNRKANAKWRQNRPLTRKSECCRNGDNAGAKSHGQPLSDTKDVASLPGHRRSERHCKHEGYKERRKGEIEERCANGNLLAGKRFERQRIKRTNEHSETSGRKEQIVEDECAFTR